MSVSPSHVSSTKRCGDVNEFAADDFTISQLHRNRAMEHWMAVTGACLISQIRTVFDQ
jgi:hypothetical protein